MSASAAPSVRARARSRTAPAQSGGSAPAFSSASPTAAFQAGGGAFRAVAVDGAACGPPRGSARTRRPRRRGRRAPRARGRDLCEIAVRSPRRRRCGPGPRHRRTGESPDGPLRRRPRARLWHLPASAASRARDLRGIGIGRRIAGTSHVVEFPTGHEAVLERLRELGAGGEPILGLPLEGSHHRRYGGRGQVRRKRRSGAGGSLNFRKRST